MSSLFGGLGVVLLLAAAILFFKRPAESPSPPPRVESSTGPQSPIPPPVAPRPRREYIPPPAPAPEQRTLSVDTLEAEDRAKRLALEEAEHKRIELSKLDAQKRVRQIPSTAGPGSSQWKVLVDNDWFDTRIPFIWESALYFSAPDEFNYEAAFGLAAIGQEARVPIFYWPPVSFIGKTGTIVDLADPATPDYSDRYTHFIATIRLRRTSGSEPTLVLVTVRDVSSQTAIHARHEDDANQRKYGFPENRSGAVLRLNQRKAAEGWQ